MAEPTANPLLRALRRIAASTDELVAEEQHKRAVAAGAQTISQIQDRQKATIRGTLAVVTLKPRESMPWLEAELRDGTGSLTLIWMGRRSIPGVTAGRELSVRGRMSYVDGKRTMYNPYYELIP